MTVDQLKYFLSLERCLNFSEAAEELNISQSSLSKQIRNLEEETGVQLFKRTTRRTVLTPAGAEFAVYAKQITNLFNKLSVAMNEYSPKLRSKIVLSSVPVMSIYRLTEMLAAFNEEKPDISIDIIEENTLLTISSLKTRRADIVFANTVDLSGHGFLTYPLLQDEMVLIVNKNHSFAGKNIISLAEAVDENFLFLGLETSAYSTCYNECIEAGFEPKVINARQSNMQIETIMDFVSNGRGISMIMAKAAEYYWKPNIRIIRLEKKCKSTMGFVVRNEPISSACKQLLDFSLHYFNIENCTSDS